jgi:hypothetical protein
VLNVMNSLSEDSCHTHGNTLGELKEPDTNRWPQDWLVHKRFRSLLHRQPGSPSTGELGATEMLDRFGS